MERKIFRFRNGGRSNENSEVVKTKVEKPGAHSRDARGLHGDRSLGSSLASAQRAERSPASWPTGLPANRQIRPKAQGGLVLHAPALEDANVVGAFVGGGVGAAAEVHRAAELVHRGVAAVVHPGAQTVDEDGEEGGAVFQECGYHLHAVRAGEEGFDGIFGGVHAAAAGEGGLGVG